MGNGSDIALWKWFAGVLASGLLLTVAFWNSFVRGKLSSHGEILRSQGERTAKLEQFCQGHREQHQVLNETLAGMKKDTGRLVEKLIGKG